MQQIAEYNLKMKVQPEVIRKTRFYKTGFCSLSYTYNMGNTVFQKIVILKLELKEVLLIVFHLTFFFME